MSLIDREYQLKVIINGKTAFKTWVGSTGLDACKRYQDFYKDPPQRIQAVGSGVYLA
jgi:hypothetical protein